MFNLGFLNLSVEPETLFFLLIARYFFYTFSYCHKFDFVCFFLAGSERWLVGPDVRTELGFIRSEKKGEARIPRYGWEYVQSWSGQFVDDDYTLKFKF